MGALLAWVGGAAQRGEVIIELDVAVDEHNVYEPDVLWSERAGLRELWLVDDEAREVLVFRRDPGFAEPVVLRSGDVLESAQLPGFALPVDELFAG